jgi:hypothetical protein
VSLAALYYLFIHVLVATHRRRDVIEALVTLFP